MSFLRRLALSLLAVCSAAHATPTVKQLYQFPDPTQWIENIAVRPNGHLLLTTYDHGRLYALDPQVTDPVPQVVAQLPNETVLLGIAEVAPDVFAVAAGILNDTSITLEHGSGQIAVIDLGCFQSQDNRAVPFRTAANLPNVQLLNGLVALPQHRHIVLSPDSRTGSIYRANTITGHVDVAFQSDQLNPGQDPMPVPLGANGLRIHGGYLYVTNTARRFFARIKINGLGDPMGDLEIITQLPANPQTVPDDFAIAKDGTAYVAMHPDSVGKITPNGTYSTLVDGQSGLDLDTPSSAALSRDGETLFVVTGGSSEAGGKGGQVVAVSLRL
jgi:sugar lactone lactonase YvrE